ncbi:MAG: 3-oxoacyl-ACP synthase [Myxococcales bacterium]|nr:3-oxoacyl-ACP synthase [Myxococcales bacterium]
MTSSRQRVAVTGVGIVSALGGTAPETFARLCAGEHGFGPVTLFDVSAQRCQLAAEVKSDAALAPEASTDGWSRTDRMALAAAREALAHAGIDRPDPDLAVAVGGTTAGMLEAEGLLAGQTQLSPELAAERLLSYPLSTPLDRVRTALGAEGPHATACSACSSGANAIGLGASWVENGRASRALVGGADALCRLTFAGFDALGVMSPEPCRPFDAARRGLTLGEGAAFLLLESAAVAAARGARVLSWLDGWSLGAEAHHITHPEPSGACGARLITRAMARARLDPRELTWVNAHGTATLQNDAAEARALAVALGPELARVFVSSCKGQIGHTLGASGAIEAALTVLAVEQGKVPPTVGLETPDLELGLRHVVGRAMPLPIRAALSLSFGFGGAGTVLAFSERAREGVPAKPTTGPSRVRAALALATPPSEPLVDRLDAPRSRRFDRASALVTLCASAVLERAGGSPGEVGLVAGSAFGNVDRTVAFLRRFFERGPRFASPADFPHLLPSAPAGNASIYLGLTGPVLATADLATSAEAALCIALALLEDDRVDALLAGSAEPHDAVSERLLSPLHRPSDAASEPRGEGAAFVLLSRTGSRSDPSVVFWSDCARPDELPVPEGRARAFGFGGAEAFVRASSWRDVPLEQPSFVGVPREAWGGFALVRAVEALSSDAADQTLVVSPRGPHAFAFVFERRATGP